MRHRHFEARVATCSSNEISVLLSHLYIISVLLSHLYIKMNILPRQARDKHSENSKKESVLSLSGQTQKSHQHVELCCVVSCRVVWFLVPSGKFHGLCGENGQAAGSRRTRDIVASPASTRAERVLRVVLACVAACWSWGCRRQF